MNHAHRPLRTMQVISLEYPEKHNVEMANEFVTARIKAGQVQIFSCSLVSKRAIVENERER